MKQQSLFSSIENLQIPCNFKAPNFYPSKNSLLVLGLPWVWKPVSGKGAVGFLSFFLTLLPCSLLHYNTLSSLFSPRIRAKREKTGIRDRILPDWLKWNLSLVPFIGVKCPKLLILCLMRHCFLWRHLTIVHWLWEVSCSYLFKKLPQPTPITTFITLLLWTTLEITSHLTLPDVR